MRTYDPMNPVKSHGGYDKPIVMMEKDFDCNLNTGGNNYDETTGVVAHNVVHHSTKYPSAITVTMVKSSATIVP